jgi:hypothetical protein
VSVIPAEAGIHNRLKNMDSDFRRNDKNFFAHVGMTRISLLTSE